LPTPPMLFLGKFLHLGTRRVYADIQTTSVMTSEHVHAITNFVEVVTNIGPFSLSRVEYAAGKSELILLNIQNGANLRYKFDFGDGSPPVEASASEVRHTFPAAGIYELRVSVSSPLEEKQVKGSVHVQQIVQLGVLTAPESETHASTTVSVEVIQGSSLTFKWFIDGKELSETRKPTWTPEYAKSGLYNVSVIAFNNVSKASSWTVQAISSIVVDLKLEQSSCPIGQCELLFSYTDGEVLSASLRVDGTVTGIRLLPGRSLKSEIMNLNRIAEHTFELAVKDRHMESKLQGIFTVDEVVTGLEITMNPSQGLINKPVEVTVTVLGGTSYSIDLSDGGDLSLHVPAQALLPLPSPQIFRHTYAEAGSYSICVTVHNVGKRSIECRTYIVAAPMGDYVLNMETTRLPIGQPLHLWFDRISGHPTPLLELQVDWGEEGAQFTYKNYVEGTRVYYKYTQRGTHNITATLSMLTSRLSFGEEVLVAYGILNFGCTLRRPVVKSGEDNVIDVYLRSLSDVRIELRGPTDQISEKVIKEPSGSIPLSISGQDIGFYTYAVNVTGEVDWKMCTVTEEVRRPIKDLEITVKDPFVGPPGKLSPEPSFVFLDTGTCTMLIHLESEAPKFC
uniref:PKD domain-containing protein n=1 Tax=Schistocephalus solidus TaxID=70667 RepID=A0A183TJ28_SCHSO